MDFTIKDKKEIKESYQLFLTNLKILSQKMIIMR